MNIEEISFKIIASVGAARSLYIEAINEAKKGNYDLAKVKIKEGHDFFSQGHHAHFELISQEADESQPNIEFNLILMHAEDQLMSAEAFGILAEQFIDVYKRIDENYL